MPNQTQMRLCWNRGKLRCWLPASFLRDFLIKPIRKQETPTRESLPNHNKKVGSVIMILGDADIGPENG